MPAWIAAIWDSIRGGIWLVPTIALLAAISAAVVIPTIDESVAIADMTGFGWLRTTADGARTTLASITGALITMASLVFSVSMVTLSLTTSQFGSRLLRTFLNSNATQLTLGVFLGASAYCLLVFQSISTRQDQAFVPHLSIGVAVCSAVASLGVFVYFMHHVATSIQAQSVVRAVAADLDEAIDILFPEQIGEAGERPDAREHAMEEMKCCPVPAHSEGYLQAIDGEILMKAAREEDVSLRLRYQPGQFVVKETALADVVPADRCSADLMERVRSAFLTGSRRTPRQDVQCAIDELVEVAVRALSPGINDPFTAAACIDYLGASLRRLATRKTPEPARCDEQGQLRIVASPVTFADALESAFGQIREYGKDSSLVHRKLLQALLIVADAARGPDITESVRRHADTVLRSARRNLHEENDVRRVEELHARVVESLENASKR